MREVKTEENLSVSLLGLNNQSKCDQYRNVSKFNIQSARSAIRYGYNCKM